MTRTFANLGTPSNGSVFYCSDCSAAVTTCAAGGAAVNNVIRERQQR